MHLVLPGGEWIALFSTVAVLLVAAKTHGRQVRIERELAGHFHASFGGENPPWVEALWRRDRRTYWATFAPAALALLGLRFGVVQRPLPAPFTAWAPDAWLEPVVLLLWAGVSASFVAGLSSLGRFLHATQPLVEARASRPVWLASALRGSAFWWGLAAAGPLAYSASAAV